MVMQDIVEPILLRCDAFDLLRWKIVCKSWYYMISRPYFIKAHAKLIGDNKEETKMNRKISMLRRPIDSNNPRKIIRNPGLLGWHHYGKWSVIGSSNGLVCMFSPSKYEIFVTNPVTRKFEYLELPPLKSYGRLHCLGFGYVPSSDDYKLVFAICKQGREKREISVRILSLKESDNWKDFGQVNYWFDVSAPVRPGILVNGALHWFWYNLTKKNTVIVSFDLAKEEFLEIPQPDDARYDWNIGCRLGSVEGLLCISSFSEDNEDSDNEDVDNEDGGIWALERYNSWKLLPEDHEMEYHVHYMFKDTDEDRHTPPQTYYCHDNVDLSRSKDHILCHKFVQTLVSPCDDNEDDDSDEATDDEVSDHEDDGSDEATDDEVSDHEDDGSDEGSMMKGGQSAKEADTDRKPFKEENPANNSVAAATGTNDEVIANEDDGIDEKEDDE